MKKSLTSFALVLLLSSVSQCADFKKLNADTPTEAKIYNYTPASRGQPGHVEMKEAYIHIKAENDIFFEEHPDEFGKAPTKKFKFSDLNSLHTLHGGDNETVIEMTAQDTVGSAKELIARGLKTVIVNFASKTKPGGGYLSGELAQEEDICRQTDLYEPLERMLNEGQYPIQHDEVIFSDGVKIFRRDWKENFGLLSETLTMGVITIPAFNLNFTMKNNDLSLFGIEKVDFYNFTDEQIAEMKFPDKKPILTKIKETLVQDPIRSEMFNSGLKNKIRAKLTIAKAKGYEAIIEGAFGCGVFENPVPAVAKAFREVLEEVEFKGAFKVVRFSILAKDPATDFNYKPFKAELSTIKGYKFGLGLTDS